MSINPFEKVSFGSLQLKNRFVMAAAADNIVDMELKKQRYEKLAKGGVGLIITGGITGDAIKGWRAIADTAHKYGTKLAIQIVNNYGIGSSGAKKLGIAVSPSKLDENNPFFANPILKYCENHAATEEEIAQIVEDYANFTELAKNEGADAVEIHSAHHNLLCLFLSPLINQRNDMWGGSIENRTRIHKEVIKAIRNKVGDFPVLIKVGVEDPFSGGLKFEEGKKAAALIASYGYDIIEVSQGIMDFANMNTGSPMRSPVINESQEAYFRPWASGIKKLIDKPVILTGGIRSLPVVEDILNKNDADLIGMCRSFIREADLINRWKGGDLSKAKCVSCNKCVTEPFPKGLRCIFDKD